MKKLLIIAVLVTVVLAGCKDTKKKTETAKPEFDRANAFVVDNFEDERAVAEVKIAGDFVKRQLNTNPAFIKNGKGSLRLLADNEADGKPDGQPTFTITLKEPVDLIWISQIRLDGKGLAIVLRYQVTGFFRLDVIVQVVDYNGVGAVRGKP